MKLSSQYVKFGDEELKLLEDHFILANLNKTLDEWLVDRSEYTKTKNSIDLLFCLLNDEVEVCNRVAYYGVCGKQILLSFRGYDHTENCNKCKAIFNSRMYCKSLVEVIKNYWPRLIHSPNYDKYVAYLLSEGK